MSVLTIQRHQEKPHTVYFEALFPRTVFRVSPDGPFWMRLSLSASKTLPTINAVDLDNGTVDYFGPQATVFPVTGAVLTIKP